ncbi:MAG TPA: ABC transporter permease [Bacillota bacterium]|nr:ABC transporter permease [Bacillota bacterium]
MLISMIWKDLLVILKDKKSLIITLCMPAILTTILGFAFQGMMSGGLSMDRANIAVVSLGSRERDIERIREFLDGPGMEGRISGEQKRDLLELLDDMDFESILYEDVLGSEEVAEFIQYERMGLEKAKTLLERGELDAVVVLPEGFTYNTFMNLAMPFRNPVTIEVIKHPDRSIKGEMVSGIVKGFTDALSAGIIAKNVLLETFIENNVGDKATREIQGLVSGMYDVGVRDVRVDRVTVEGKRALSSFQYYAVGMAVMFILYVAADGGQYAMDEVNNGTYRRLIAAGTGRWRFFASRFAATTLFAIMQFTVLKYYSAFAFKTDWGSPLGVALLSVFLAVAVGGLSVLLSALNLRLKNSRATIVFQAVVIQVFALLGGSFFPVSGIPVMRKLGSLTINGAAMSGFLKLMMGYGLAEVAGTLAVLSGITLALLAAGVFAAAGTKEV